MNREEISKALPDVEDTPPRPDFMYKSKLAYIPILKDNILIMLPKTMMYLVVQNAIKYAKDTLHRNILQNILFWKLS